MENDEKTSIFIAERIDRAKYLRYFLADDVADLDNEVLRCQFSNGSFAAPAKTNEENNNESEQKRKDERKEACFWHKRLGHIPSKYLKILAQVADGVPKRFDVSDGEFRECDVCIMTKFTRSSHTKDTTRATRVFEIVCSDVLGSLIKNPRSDEQYVLTFIDDLSNYAVTYTIRARIEVANALKDYVVKTEAILLKNKMRLFRCDNANEFVSGEVVVFCREKGIQIDPSNPYTPEQNSRAERYNQRLMERVQAMIIESGMDQEEWPLVMKCAQYIINRTPTRSNPEMKTPFEM